MIRVKNLTKLYKVHIKQNNLISDLLFRKYKLHRALNNVSFRIDEDELVGFIGPNGAGKTTTLKILSGILYPTSGDISVLGFVPFKKNIKFLKQISFVMGQRNQLIWDLPALDTFELNQEIYDIPMGQFKSMVDELTSLLDCHNLLDKPVKTLSLGERMKMELIAGLVHQPKIVFFDEPTIGLDIFSQEVIRNFIKKYQKEYKASIILTSHYLEDVKKMAKRLIVIDKGNILYDGSLKSILEKYSSEKKISITLERFIEPQKLNEIGSVTYFSYPKVILKVNKIKIPEIMKSITINLSYSDLTIEDESIEEIIKKFFRQSSEK